MNTVRPRSAAQNGFTLIELLIAVTILAVLAAIALPNYQQYIQRGHRAQAKAALLQAAQWMERIATANGVYPETTTTDTPFPTTLSAAAGPRYVLSLKASTQAAYTLLATPQGIQTSDRCATLTLDHSGVHGVTTGDTAGGADLIAECWSR
jgi:type IV pilus assembly protein PilE